ncbi:MAG: DUF3006 domain-containing protein, partial [Acutalibacteraceae bacterium]
NKTDRKRGFVCNKIRQNNTMKKLKIIKFDGTYFICEDKDKKMFAIEKADMPQNAKDGDTVIISDDGNIGLKNE